jgi:gamma-glutamyltranspeptidase
MVNKLVVSLILILMILGIAIYFRVEFKYKMVAEGQNMQILKDLKAVEKMQLKPEESRLEKIAEVGEKHKIAFATDLQALDNHLFNACKPECHVDSKYYKNFSRLVALVDLKKMWVVRKNWSKDTVAYYIQDQEVAVIKNTLLKRREYIADQYAKLPNYELKEVAMASIKTIDEKIKELQKK